MLTLRDGLVAGIYGGVDIGAQEADAAGLNPLAGPISLTDLERSRL